MHKIIQNFILFFGVFSVLSCASDKGPLSAGRGNNGGGVNAASTGKISPTVYYHPVFRMADNINHQVVPFQDREGHTFFNVQEFQRTACGIEGSCSIVGTTHIMRHFAYTATINNTFRFKERIAAMVNECPYGIGASDMCIDPFFSVAAVEQFHKPGDIIFIPALVGVHLPSGEDHDGYLIVRDYLGSGSTDRFDFFTGFYSPTDSANIFVAQLHLNDQTTKLDYQVVTDSETIARVKSRRGFPRLTDTVRSRGLNEIQLLSNQ